MGCGVKFGGATRSEKMGYSMSRQLGGNLIFSNVFLASSNFFTKKGSLLRSGIVGSISTGLNPYIFSQISL